MKTYRGQCRCGQVQFEVNGPPLLTAACHCKGCQRMTSGAFSLSALYSDDRFRVLGGETVLGGLKGATRHYSCADCLSWLFTRPEGLDGMVNVRSALFEDANHFPPFVEFYRREGLSRCESGAPHSFEDAPDVDAFLKLADDYKSWDNRPE